MPHSQSRSQFEIRRSGFEEYESSPDRVIAKMSGTKSKKKMLPEMLDRKKRCRACSQFAILLTYVFGTTMLLVISMNHPYKHSVTYQTMFKLDAPTVKIENGGNKPHTYIQQPAIHIDTNITVETSRDTFPNQSQKTGKSARLGGIVEIKSDRMKLHYVTKHRTTVLSKDTGTDKRIPAASQNDGHTSKTLPIIADGILKNSISDGTRFKSDSTDGNKDQHVDITSRSEQQINQIRDVESNRSSVQKLKYDDMFDENLLHTGTASKESIQYKTRKLPYQNSAELSDDVTVVTAYFNIGSFKKGWYDTFTPNKYLEWMKIFSKIRNPLVVYLDKQIPLLLMEKLRAGKNNTKIVLVNRENMWSFRLRDQIKEIFSQPRYPKFDPNTKVPEYSCVMHAKFELLNRSISHNYFNTKYFMWLDVGLFRDLHVNNDFGLYLPPNFNESKVAYGEVYRFYGRRSFRDIVYGNHLWVGGACNVGRWDVLLEFVKEYRRYLDIFLSQKLMDTDQQIIYAMFVNEGRKHKPKVEIQAYEGGWFGLGYICKESWERRQIGHTRKTWKYYKGSV